MAVMLNSKKDAWKNADKCLAIPVQCFNGMHLWIKDFKSNDDILEAFKASTLSTVLKIKNMTIDHTMVTIAPMKSFQLLHPLSIVITARDCLDNDKFVKYADIGEVEILQPEVSPQTTMSYYIPSVHHNVQKLFHSGYNTAKEYYVNH